MVGRRRAPRAQTGAARRHRAAGGVAGRRSAGGRRRRPGSRGRSASPRGRRSRGGPLNRRSTAQTGVAGSLGVTARGAESRGAAQPAVDGADRGRGVARRHRAAGGVAGRRSTGGRRRRPGSRGRSASPRGRRSRGAPLNRRSISSPSHREPATAAARLFASQSVAGRLIGARTGARRPGVNRIRAWLRSLGPARSGGSTSSSRATTG